MLWTVARQTPLSMGFSRQEYWSGLLGPPPGDLPDPGIEPMSPASQVDHLGSLEGSITMNKVSGGDRIPVELFQILKDDAVKVMHPICQHMWKTQQWPQDWKGQISFQSQRKAMPKNDQTTTQMHSSHMLVK